jgi:hypothetical protein
MPVTKEPDKTPDEAPEKKSSKTPLAKVVAALARNATFSQHQPEDAQLVSDWLADQEA